MHTVIFWSIFLPLGVKYSVDSIKFRVQKNHIENISSWITMGYFLQNLFLLGVLLLNQSFISNFSVIYVLPFIAFLPTIFWEKMEKIFHWENSPKLIVFYDFECGFCFNAVHFIKMFLFLESVTIESAYDNPKVLTEMDRENSWVAQDDLGKYTFRFDAFLTLLRGSYFLRFFIPVLSLYPVYILGNATYKILSSHRKTFCPIYKPSTGEEITMIPFWATLVLVVFTIINTMLFFYQLL